MSILRKIMQKSWKTVEKADAERIVRQHRVQGVSHENDISYLSDGNPLHQLNMYYPEKLKWNRENRLPVIIDIHGGGLMYGDKELNRNYCEYLASKGFAVMGMSYRLLPETDLQGIVQDVFASVHWLEHFGEDRCLDLNRIYLTGDSAGGHLASLVICIQNSKKLQDIYQVTPFSFEFAGTAICNGVCEMHDYFNYEKKLNEKIDKEIVSMICGKAGAKAPWAAYMNFSQCLEEVDKTKLPKLMVIGSESDSFYRQTKWILQNLEKYQLPSHNLIWKKEDGVHLDHVFQVSHWEWKESLKTNDQMIEFFNCK